MSNVSGKGRPSPNIGIAGLGSGGNNTGASSLIAPGAAVPKKESPFAKQETSAGSGAGFKAQMSILPMSKGPDPTVKMMELLELVFQDEKDIERDVLKELLESIINETKNNADKTHKVDTKLVSKYMIFEK